jgi:hypothetical protein
MHSLVCEQSSEGLLKLLIVLSVKKVSSYT